MLYIPGFLIGWVTFPGIILHEYAHKRACEWRKIPVTAVTYFSLDGSGQVQHRQPREFRDTLAIATAPLLVNTVLAIGFYLLTALFFQMAAPGPGLEFEMEFADIAMVLCLWLGISTGWHAIPSFGDTGNIWREVKSNWRSSPVILLSTPLVLVLYVGNVLSFLWFDLIYSLGIGLFVWVVLSAVV